MDGKAKVLRILIDEKTVISEALEKKVEELKKDRRKEVVRGILDDEMFACFVLFSIAGITTPLVRKVGIPIIKKLTKEGSSERVWATDAIYFFSIIFMCYRLFVFAKSIYAMILLKKGTHSLLAKDSPYNYEELKKRKKATKDRWQYWIWLHLLLIGICFGMDLALYLQKLEQSTDISTVQNITSTI